MMNPLVAGCLVGIICWFIVNLYITIRLLFTEQWSPGYPWPAGVTPWKRFILDFTIIPFIWWLFLVVVVVLP